MIENLAIVLERQGQKVRLSTASPTGCAKCDRGEGCGGGIFGKLIKRRLEGLLLDDPDLNLQRGQFVILGLPSGIFLRATAAIYVLPLVGLLLFAFAALGWGAPDPVVALIGLLGLAVGAGIGPLVRQKFIDAQLVPRVLRRAQSNDMQACGSAPQ
ncbi:MAG: SoxR reducing system RseC family protein [Oceanococcus sp.]